jgi:hypothetical protein
MNDKLKKMLMFLINRDYVSYLEELHADLKSGSFDDRMKELVMERLNFDGEYKVNEEKVVREALRFTTNCYGDFDGEFFNEKDDLKVPDYYS